MCFHSEMSSISFSGHSILSQKYVLYIRYNQQERASSILLVEDKQEKSYILVKSKKKRPITYILTGESGSLF